MVLVQVSMIIDELLVFSMQMMMRCWFDDDDVMDVGRKARKKIFMGPPFFIGRA
jgi:hypothetical protein